MKNIAIRALSGGIYVALIVAGVLSGPTIFLVLLLLLGTLAVNEFLNLTHPIVSDKMSMTDVLLRVIDCFGAYSLIFIITMDSWSAFIGVFSFIAYMIVRLCAQLWIKGENALMSLSFSLMSQLYVALPISLMGAVYHICSPAMLLLLFVLVWVNDTFAFLTGCTLGRHRLFERISPKKSWEGFVGGAVFTIIAAILAATFMPQYFHMELWKMGILGLTVTTAATLGDLIESLIKRTLDVKDSGKLIPGHGGILDRIDSLLLVVPASLLILIIIAF
ncbi:MAG: phosphatidate cytidylyltransferase [Muribaculaceae bacterium]|nr:phosphatidate cytidylyltransferase [Muribaculaceae bacterium]